MPVLFMLVGLPATGKTTWVKRNLPHLNADVISSDDIIERIAEEKGISYNEAFESEIVQATNHMMESANLSISLNNNIIWDQTNLSRKSRSQKLAMFGSNYTKVAVVFDYSYIGLAELSLRLNSRPGKMISHSVLNRMRATFEMPSVSEGFDAVFLA